MQAGHVDGRTFFVAHYTWLNQLRWDVASDGPHVSVLELVLDFEVVTGIDVPVQGVEDEEARRTFSRKAKVFGGVLRAAELMHGSRIIPANFKGTSGWLRSLTGGPCSAPKPWTWWTSCGTVPSGSATKRCAPSCEHDDEGGDDGDVDELGGGHAVEQLPATRPTRVPATRSSSPPCAPRASSTSSRSATRVPQTARVRHYSRVAHGITTPLRPSTFSSVGSTA